MITLKANWFDSMNPELLTQTGFSSSSIRLLIKPMVRTEPAVSNSGIHRFVTLFPALLTALLLYASNMRCMLIEDLIHAEFFSCTTKLEQVKEILWAGCRGRGALMIKKNCPDLIEGSFFVRICFRIVKIQNQINKVRDIKWLLFCPHLHRVLATTTYV